MSELVVIKLERPLITRKSKHLPRLTVAVGTRTMKVSKFYVLRLTPLPGNLNFQDVRERERERGGGSIKQGETMPIAYVNDRYTVGNEEYIDTQDKLQIFPKLEQRYAKNSDGDEFYPYIANKPVFLWHPDKRRKVYAKNAAGDEIYPNDPTSLGLGQIVLTIINDKQWAKLKDGSDYYPLDEQGGVAYPIDRTHKETYTAIDKDGKHVIGRDHLGKQRYAKESNGDEYYPPNHQGVGVVATDMGEDGKIYPVYAKTHDGNVVYSLSPTGQGEIYLRNPYADGDMIDSPRKDVTLNKYAKNANGDEFYPQGGEGARVYEITLNDTYAFKNDGTPFYPLDVNDNEYVLIQLKKLTLVYPVGYPSTYDNNLIVPRYNKKAAWQIQQYPLGGKIPKCTPHDRVYYFTKEKANRLTRTINSVQTKYTVEKDVEKSSWLTYMGILFALMILAAMLYFFAL